MKGGHVIEVKVSSLFEAVAEAVKMKGGHIATDGFRPIKVRVQEPEAEYEVKLKDFMAWLDRQSIASRDDRSHEDSKDTWGGEITMRSRLRASTWYSELPT